MEEHYNKQSDKDLKNKFEAYAPTYDAASMWSGIDKALDEAPKKEKKVLWLMLFGFLVGAGFLYGLFSLSLSGTTITKGLEAGLEAIEIHELQQEKFAPESNRTESNNTKDITPESAFKKIEEGQKSPATHQIKMPMDIADNAKNMIVTDNNTSLSYQNIQGAEFAAQKINNTIRQNNNILSNEFNPTDKFSSVSGQTRKAFEAITLQKEVVAKASHWNAAAISYGQLTLIPTDFDAPVLAMNYIQYGGEPLGKANSLAQGKEGAFGHWTLGMDTGIGFVYSSHTLSQSSGQALYDLRKNIERDHTSFSISGHLGYRFSPKWNLTVGLQYSNATTSAILRSKKERLFTMKDTVAIINTLGGSSIVTGDRAFTETTISSHRRYNRYRQLMVPIVLRYSQNITDRWGYQLGIGWAPTVWQKTTGYEQDLLNTVYDLSNDNDLRIRTNGNHSGILEVQITRALPTSGKIYFGLRYMPDLSGIYNEDFIIQKKLNLLQINAGVSIPLKF